MFPAYRFKGHVDNDNDNDFKPRTSETPRRLQEFKVFIEKDDFVEEDDFIEEENVNEEDNSPEEAGLHRHRRGIHPTRPSQAGVAKKAKADPTTPQRQARVLAMTAARGPAPRSPAQDNEQDAAWDGFEGTRAMRDVFFFAPRGVIFPGINSSWRVLSSTIASSRRRSRTKKRPYPVYKEDREKGDITTR